MLKSFFEKKAVKIVEGVLIGLASAGLIAGGVSAGTVAKIPPLVVGVFTAIEAIITIIQGMTTKEAENS